MPESIAALRTDAPKRIVAGVVLDPYVVDLQDDWVPPDAVETAAHEWASKWRILGEDHDARAEGLRVVESWLVPYPPGQRELAVEGKPHAIWSIPYGTDRVLSGSWVLAVQAETDEAWERIASGEWSAFSIGGFGRREEIDPVAMPAVEVIEL
jgi:hypothetical protein